MTVYGFFQQKNNIHGYSHQHVIHELIGTFLLNGRLKNVRIQLIRFITTMEVNDGRKKRT